MDLVPGICPLCPDCHPGRLTKWPGRGSHPGVHAPQRHRWSSRPCPPAVSRPWRRSRSASTIGIKIVMDRTECHRLSVPAFRNESDHTGGRRDSLPVGFAARPLFAFFYPDVFRGTRISAQVLWDIIYCFYRADVVRLAQVDVPACVLAGARLLPVVVFCLYALPWRALSLAARRTASDDVLFDGLYRWRGGRDLCQPDRAGHL